MDTTAKYLSIAQDLSSKIKYGQYPVGDKLPSEAALMRLYGTSRDTIRKALEELTNNGLIQKVKGKGSIVLNTSRFTFPISGITTFSELNQRQQMHALTKIINLEERALPENIADQVAVEQRATTFVRRLRQIEQEPIVVDEDYVLKSIVPHIPRSVAENSLYKYFEQELNLDIAYATKSITVEPGDDYTCQLLNLPAKSLVVIVRSLTYLADTSFFQYTTSLHRPDRFKFIDFARRSAKL
ncbi:trehalose operon repressor [Agrilactobacillus fermenti]|uniref:trehalose operon repressor n=1 Tax=Agrilactobacillus fermenti TaxID=2586909 RepID=UPI0038B36DE5